MVYVLSTFVAAPAPSSFSHAINTIDIDSINNIIIATVFILFIFTSTLTANRTFDELYQFNYNH